MNAQFIQVAANYYQHFDADFERDVPAEGYGGWKRAELEMDMAHTAVVVMHAWDTGTAEQFPGWHRCVEYLPRAAAIAQTVFPPLLDAVRNAGVNLFHVVGGGDYYKAHPGYQRAVELAGPPPAPLEYIAGDSSLQALQQFRARNVFVGEHNEADVKRGFEHVDFPVEARPLPTEGVAENAEQLFALCKAAGVNHLIYAGFAINWCLLLSPGGMADMSKRGVMCSAFRQAVTAVENKETAHEELCKQIALWRVALAYGFVFDVPDFIEAVQKNSNPFTSS
jgi:hypothetical protein